MESKKKYLLDNHKLENPIRAIIKNVFHFLLALYCSIKIKSRLKNDVDNKIYLLDIDNTLADTFHSYKYYFKSYDDRLLSLAIFLGMRKKYMEIFDNNKNVFFISARRISSQAATYNWLESNGLKVEKKNIFNVNSVNVKISLIKLLKKNNNYHITLIDDLSYNHENGVVKYYKNQIDAIYQFKILHIDAKQIEEINNKL